VTTQQTALVIDDHPLVARGIADFLQSHCAFSLVTAVTDVEELWRYLAIGVLPSLIVVDFWLPGGASLILLSELKTEYPHIPLLVISADDNAAVENKVHVAGVQGFLNKQEAPEVFVHAVNTIMNGETWFNSAEQRLLNTYQPNELPVTAQELGLTARQGQILSMVMNGLPNKRIAKTLNLTEQTVKEHVSGILSRLGVNNRVEAMTKLRGRRLE
jgi:DNA-binding NarL/FixJ family response regulator